jgi:hypothetical protein
MNIKDLDFFNIPLSIDRKEFMTKYFSNIRENAPIDSFFKNDWYNFQISGIYNFLSDNSSHKWMVVQFDHDEVLVSIKFVTNFTNVYIRLQHYPKSLSGIKENEDIVFNKLKEFEYVNLLWESKFNIDKYTLDWNKRVVDTNFYDNVVERWKEVNGNHYMKKRKIKRFLKDDDYYLIKAEEKDLSDVKECFSEWSSFKEKNKGLHNKKLFNKIFKEWKYLITNPSIEVLLFKYKEVLLGCAIYVKMGNSYQNITEFSRTIRSCELVIDDERFKTFLQGCAQIMNYFHLKYFLNKTNIISYAGSMEKDKLYYHKLNNYSNKLEYYSTDLKN